MTWPNSHFIRSDGFQIATYSFGPKDGLSVILVHGWPEIAYSWKLTIPALITAGYRVIAFDLRGFGRSDVPVGDVHYAMPQLVGDIEAVMDGYGINHAAIIGHDWGASIVWHAARMISQRITKVIGICVPHTARAPAAPLSIIEKRAGRRHYFLEYKYRPDKVAELFSQDVDGFFRLMFRSVPDDAIADDTFTFIPEKFKAFLKTGAPPLKGQILNDLDRAVFIEAYTRTGFRSGMNLYRNIDENWYLSEGMSDHISQPVLMISPERDLLLPPELAAPMKHMVDDFTQVRIPDCGHWAMWEQPEAVNAAILKWLNVKYEV
ncbi:MAG: alpha/beta hydrolase [Litorimonas sp.]